LGGLGCQQTAGDVDLTGGLSAYPVMALNEFVAANRTLANSHNRPIPVSRDFKKQTFSD